MPSNEVARPAQEHVFKADANSECAKHGAAADGPVHAELFEAKKAPAMAWSDVTNDVPARASACNANKSSSCTSSTASEGKPS